MHSILANNRLKLRLFLLLTAAALAAASCNKKTVVVYKAFPENVTLISPANSAVPHETLPVFYWEPLTDASSYQIQVAADMAFISVEINETLNDTSYDHGSTIGNGNYYWRVRAKNNDGVWGDWSEAVIWSFRINDQSQYMDLLSSINSVGIAQDVMVMDGVAYIADAHAELTLIDVSDPANPFLIVNLDTYNDDFANSVWKAPAQYANEIVFVADEDAKIACIDIREPYNPYSIRNVQLGWSQNMKDIAGTVFMDTIYLFTVHALHTHRKIYFFQIVFDNEIPRFGDYYPPAIELPADAMGVCFDSIPVTVEYSRSYPESVYYEQQIGMFVFAAVSQAGLWWFDVSCTHAFDAGSPDTALLLGPRPLGSEDTPSVALKVFAEGGFVYVADDRGGLQIFDLPDTIPAFDHDSVYAVNPVLISNINTSGRTKDVQIVGNYCFLADGSGGLKIIDVSNPYAPAFVAAYSTPYAYGVWADEDYIYIADRDNGLMIFENKVN
jgi:hypothetical protein